MKKTSQKPKSILITGASSGIGAALAIHYARPGISLFLSGRDRSRLTDVATLCRQRGSDVTEGIIDVRDRASMKNWVDLCDHHCLLDLVIANAGISGGTGNGGESGNQVREIFEINVNGVFNTIDPAITHMLERGRGQVGIVSSLASFTGWPGAPAYAASKAAIRVYGEALRGRLYHKGVMVNVICPGFIETPMTATNDYPMPFMISAEAAAKHIALGLAADRARIAFPYFAYMVSGFIGLVPPALTTKILSKCPEKSARTHPSG